MKSAPTNQASEVASGKAMDLTDQLQNRLGNYEGLKWTDCQLNLVKEIHRRFCEIYLFSLSPESKQPDLVVKVPIGHSDLAYQEQLLDHTFVDRPRLFGRVEPDSKPWKEYAALRRIQSHFDALGDSRFGVVRVYDLLPQQQAMVMQWIDQSSLRQRLYATHRLSAARKASRLETAFSNTGAWLRQHHQLPALEHCESRSTSRDDYLAAVEQFIAYLSNHVDDPDELRRMHQQIIRLANEHLPSSIPCGQVHGDFAPRNVFIDNANRVSVFDTLGRFNAPIYEDIAKMLMTVKASGPQMLSRGMLYDRKRLQRYEDAFLEGYFDDQTIPLTSIRLFLAQLILEHWAAVVFQHEQQRGFKRVVKGVRRSLWKAGFLTYLREILVAPVGTRMARTSEDVQ
ncbi:hypothetical protein RMSM_06660 [Rhodopirellula maiorica SM1]|uniref:Aminoglycoside phosphotransferase domain-containing protein n=2 Tax=Novipirellula TaxID=2795426 RepID=M5RM05_9BACT|nr:hypothetical protein RMSM_06660 [Rhodopirellula maiorica SM1]